MVAAMLVEGGARCSMAEPARPTTERAHKLQQDGHARGEVGKTQANQEAEAVGDQEPAARREGGVHIRTIVAAGAKAVVAAIVVAGVVAIVLEREPSLT